MMAQPIEKYRDEFRGFYEEGQADGRIKDRAEAVLDLLEDRGLAVSPDVRQRILACKDLAQLRRWQRAATTATTASAIFNEP